jgi:hypothetical protein
MPPSTPGPTRYDLLTADEDWLTSSTVAPEPEALTDYLKKVGPTGNGDPLVRSAIAAIAEGLAIAVAVDEDLRRDPHFQAVLDYLTRLGREAEAILQALHLKTGFQTSTFRRMVNDRVFPPPPNSLPSDIAFRPAEFTGTPSDEQVLRAIALANQSAAGQRMLAVNRGLDTEENTTIDPNPQAEPIAPELEFIGPIPPRTEPTDHLAAMSPDEVPQTLADLWARSPGR